MMTSRRTYKVVSLSISFRLGHSRWACIKMTMDLAYRYIKPLYDLPKQEMILEKASADAFACRTSVCAAS